MIFSPEGGEGGGGGGGGVGGGGKGFRMPTIGKVMEHEPCWTRIMHEI